MFLRNGWQTCTKPEYRFLTWTQYVRWLVSNSFFLLFYSLNYYFDPENADMRLLLMKRWLISNLILLKPGFHAVAFLGFFSKFLFSFCKQKSEKFLHHTTLEESPFHINLHSYTFLFSWKRHRSCFTFFTSRQIYLRKKQAQILKVNPK